MELNHLKYFYEVARLGSFTKASKALRISQPSISKMVKLLEQEQNVRLLDRAKRGGVQLTPTGKRFFQSCVGIFGEIDNLKNAVEHEKEECAGDLSIGASDNLCNYVLPELLAPYIERHPKVRMKIFSGTSDSIKSELLSSNSELGIVYTPVRESCFQVEPLGFAEFVIVHAGNTKNKRSSKNTKMTTEDLRTVPYVGSRVADYSKPYPALEMLCSIGLKPTVIVETNNQETQKRLVIKGYGYTVVPKFMIESELREGTLMAVSISRKIGSKVYLVKKKNRTLTKPALLFENHLRAVISRFL